LLLLRLHPLLATEIAWMKRNGFEGVGILYENMKNSRRALNMVPFYKGGGVDIRQVGSTACKRECVEMRFPFSPSHAPQADSA